MTSPTLRDQLKPLKTKLKQNTNTDEQRGTVVDKSVVTNKDSPKKPRSGRRRTGKREQVRGTGGMVYLKTVNVPPGLKPENIKRYTNINDTSLRKTFPLKFNTAFGAVISIERGIDFALYAKIRPEHLLQPKLSSATTRTLGRKRAAIPNYWAFVGYLVLERISQDPKLTEILMKDNVKLINVIVTETDTVAGPIMAISPVDDAMYLGVIREVVNMLHKAGGPNKDPAAVIGLINSLKRRKDLSAFHGTGFTTDMF